MSVKLTLDIILPEVNNMNISSITSLNIHDKNINDISILSKFQTLENISLVNNNIKDLNVFKNLKNLKKLNLKDNEITQFDQLEPLKTCKQLESLCLKDNPITKEPNYTQKIKELLPQLKKIDDIEIKQNINNNKEIKIPIKTDIKKIDKLNMITNKFIKFKASKNKTNAYSGSPMRYPKNKNSNNDVNKINSSGKKKQNENISNNNSNKKSKSDDKNVQKNDKKENNDNNNNKNEKNENNENNEQNDEESFEIININDEKKKIEESRKEENNKNNPMNKIDFLSYSFKKKRTNGKFYKKKRKDEENNVDANATLDNIKIENNLINTFNDENRNLNYNLSNSKYSKKIIGKFPGGRNLLSQSIRYDDENEDENDNSDDVKVSQKSKLVSLKNRLFSKLTNQIYTNKKANKINVNDNEKEKEKEKVIIKSIKLLLSNLGESELEQINKDLINAISKNNK
jgi:hypothetical protein